MYQTLAKLEKLDKLLMDLQSVAVGFSGGVDSSFLAMAAQRTLGNKAVAVTAYSSTLPENERQQAITIAKHIGIKHVLLPINELDSADFVANTAQRCYFCKQHRFGSIAAWAKLHGYEWVLEGSNQDDAADFRPGMQAVAELPRVRSPLLEVEMTKSEIRSIAKEWRLPTWNKLSAACLSSRIIYGLEVTEERLKQIELAEAFLKPFCKGQIRVRHHDSLARIEVAPEDIVNIIKPANAPFIVDYIKKLGFTFVTVDLMGYRTGSMNEALNIEI